MGDEIIDLSQLSLLLVLLLLHLLVIHLEMVQSGHVPFLHLRGTPGYRLTQVFIKPSPLFPQNRHLLV